jgi:serine/threonine protein kinase
MFLNDTLFNKRTKTKMLWEIFNLLGTPELVHCPNDKFHQNNSENIPKFNPKGLSFIRKFHRDFDENALDLLTKMLNVDSWKRPTCQQILDHPFLKS